MDAGEIKSSEIGEGPNRIAVPFYDDKNGTLLLSVPQIAKLPNSITASLEDGFEAKSEQHITAIGYSQAKTIREVLRKLPPDSRTSSLSSLQQLIATTDWQYSPLNQFFHISKDYPNLDEHRESIVQLVDVPQLDSFYKELNKIFGTKLPKQLPHITLLTKSTNPENMKAGIAINSQDDFEAMHPTKVPVGGLILPSSDGLYPYKAGSHGFLFHKQFQEGKQDVEGGSGNVVVSEISENKISLTDQTSENKFKLVATVDKDNVLLFDLRTREKNADGEVVHPDLFAAKFLGYALEYFKANGKEITKAKSIWKPWSVNYKTYMRLSKTSDAKEAASKTWAGQTFGFYGFSVDKVLDRLIVGKFGAEEWVEVFYSKK